MTYFLKKLLGQVLWSPGLRIFFWKICKTLRPPPHPPRSYIFNVSSIIVTFLKMAEYQECYLFFELIKRF